MQKKLPTYDLESDFFNRNIIPAGVDEAGRGCIAGPVVAAAVILPRNFDFTIGINDSKVLSAQKRDEVYSKIILVAESYSIGIVDNIKIDEINILQATMEAMKIAIYNLSVKPGHLLIDGNYYRDKSIPYTTVVDGDAKCISIAAASIIAKVTRDRWMKEKADIMYPEFSFSLHKGYGTKKHYEAITKHGLTPIHRKSFLKKYFIKQETLFT